MAIMKGGGYVVGKPKKLVKVTRNIHSMPRLLATKQKKHIVDRVNK